MNKNRNLINILKIKNTNIIISIKMYLKFFKRPEINEKQNLWEGKSRYWKRFIKLVNARLIKKKLKKKNLYQQ